MSTPQKTLRIERHDHSNDRSLRAWSAADEYLLQAFAEQKTEEKRVALYHDRFGYLACHLQEHEPTTVLTHKSQEKALRANCKANNIEYPDTQDPLSALEHKVSFVLLKVPKSLGLFQLFLEHIAANTTENAVVQCAFMTRHFSPKMLQIAEQYFEDVQQSKAQKKARLLTLRNKKLREKTALISSLPYGEHNYRQYLGVFSAEHIDYATQFFLEHVEIEEGDGRILDLASGNGIIGKELLRELPNAQLHLMDDAFLAVESAKMNVQGEGVQHHWNNELEHFEADSFDLIVSNPPFHFEYEVNIQVPLNLFRGCYRCLKKGGNLQIVASQHLNYKTHLEPLFEEVYTLAEDKKFVVYKCVK